MSGIDTSNEKEANFTFLWKIENFSYCGMESNEAVGSAPFFVEGLNNMKFKLLLYPRGGENEKNITFYLQTDTGYLPAIKYELSFLAADGSDLQTWDGEIRPRQYSFVTVVGNSTFVTRDEVFKRKKDVFIPRDTLTTRCRMWWSDSEGNATGTDGLYYTSRIAVDRMCLVWTIKEFSTLLKITKRVFLNSEEVRIVVFVSDNVVSKNAVQVQIFQTNTAAKSFSTCRISVLDDKGEECCYWCGEHVFLKQDEEQLWHFPTQLTEKQLLAKKYLLGSLRLEIAVSDGHVSNEIENLCSINASIATDISSSKSPNLLADDLHCLYIERKYCDAALQLKDPLLPDQKMKEFPVHKNVLCARSPVFCAMFKDHTTEGQTGAVEIPDLDEETVSRMLTFLYTDTLEDTLQWEHVKKLFYAADKYGIQHLRCKCLPFLKSELSISNACEILVLADTHQDNELLNTVVDFILSNEEIFSSDGWKVLEQNYPQLTNKIYRQIILKKGDN